MVSHTAANTITAENFIRSTTEPSTSAMVIAAKVIWNATKTYSGISTPAVKVAAWLAGVTPDRNALPKPAMKFDAPPDRSGPKVSE